MQLDNEQEQALKLMLSGKNVFLTGEAGTGKSTVLHEFKRRATQDCVFLAPTGIAAINVGGTTIHSFFLLQPGLLTPDNIEDIENGKRKRLIRATKTIIIDEISMLRSDVFAAIDFRLRSLASGNNQRKPFGGKQIILVGDFFQLPPVVKTGMENNYIMDKLGGWYCFQTRLWQEAHFQCVCLKTIHRQKDDRMFVQVLNNIRHGRLLEQDIDVEGQRLNAVEVLNRFCLNNTQAIPPVNLCTTNRETIAINTMMKSRLDGDVALFKAQLSGRFRESDFPTEVMLELKPGARVMVLCNKHLPNGEFEYVNGDIGVVSEISDGNSPMVTVNLDKGNTVSLSPNRWSNYDYVIEEDKNSGKSCIRQREVGTFFQIPLKLAYAITIHKAQGLTLDSVALRLGSGCFAHGQLYTALSRCRSIGGLSIERAVMPEDLILDQAVVDFYASIDQPPKASASVTIDIPPEHEAAVLAFLAQLQAGQAPAQPCQPPARQVILPPSPSQVQLTAPVVKDEPAMFPKQDELPFFYGEEDKIYSHPDLEHLMIVYNGQTGKEKSDGMTRGENGIGVNRFDAPILTPIAEKYASCGYVTRDELSIVSRLIRKYHRQWG